MMRMSLMVLTKRKEEEEKKPEGESKEKSGQPVTDKDKRPEGEQESPRVIPNRRVRNPLARRINLRNRKKVLQRMKNLQRLGQR